MENTLLFTEKQLSRKARNDEIAASFKKLRKKNPDISNERIFAEIAKNYPISSASVRVICYKRGLC